MQARGWVAAGIVSCLLAGCAATGPTSPSTSGSSPVPRPIAPDIAPVSISSPTPDAQVALDACLITDSTHDGASTLGVALVEGMGKVVPARDAPIYAPLTGLEPEIQTDAPAWVIAIAGVVSLPLADTMRNPTCVVVGGQATWFDTDAHSTPEGWVTARPLALPPIYRLPPLVP